MTKYVAICPKCERFIIMPDFSPAVYCCNHLEPFKLFETGFVVDNFVPYEKIVCKVLPIEEVHNGEKHD